MYDVTIKGLDEQIQLLGGYDKTAMTELTHGMSEATRAIARSAQVKAPNFSGELAASMTSRVMTMGSQIIGEVYSSASNPIYPLVMEYGRRPGAKPPPVEAIRPWVESVLGDGSLAYVVARSIGRKGIKGKFFLRKAYRENANAIVGLFGLIVDRIAAKLVVKG
jgi:hypothetical protein